MGKWVHDQFGKSSKSRYCACCMEKKDNAASKKKQIKESDHHSIQRKEGQTAR